MPNHFFTQQSAGFGRVKAGPEGDFVDEINIINELRQIVEDLAIIVGQVKLGDGNYPADKTVGILAINVKKNNFEAEALPTLTDDETLGYNKGSIWIYEGEAYICIDATEDSADWKGITNTEYIS